MKKIAANMSGNLWKVLVAAGDEVTKGQEIAILESMKMEIPIEAVESGKVNVIHKNEGDFIDEGEIIMELE